MSEPKVRGSTPRRGHARRQASNRRLKVGAFVVVAAAILGIAAFLVVNPLRAVRAPAPGANAQAGEQQQVLMSMDGYEPQAVRVPADRPFTIRMVNLDSQFHTDGGGWHQFRLESLNIDVRVPPQSDRTQAFAGLAPGTYEFYCDICCGGKENPAMRGVIEVTG